MRTFACLLLFSGQLFAQDLTRAASNRNGTFFVDGVQYQYAVGANITVVAAAHSVLNHKFMAVKVRVYNASQHSISVQPENVVVEDVVSGREVTAVSASELARRMRKPYNMARFAVAPNGGGAMDPSTADMMNPQMLAMMQALAAQQASNNNNRMAASHTASVGRNVLYTDTPGALEDGDGVATCDQVCQLRNQETEATDALAQLQRQTSPESVEDYALLANTVPPRANVGGVLYYPIGKLSQAEGLSEHAKKGRLVRVTVAVIGDRYQFELPVE